MLTGVAKKVPQVLNMVRHSDSFPAASNLAREVSGDSSRRDLRKLNAAAIQPGKEKLEAMLVSADCFFRQPSLFSEKGKELSKEFSIGESFLFLLELP